jgi:hypothetical protein
VRRARISRVLVGRLLLCGAFILAVNSQVAAGEAATAIATLDCIAEPEQTTPVAPAVPYTPITGAERVDYVVDGTIGAKSLAVGVIAAGWQTGINTPEEWGRTGTGFARRYLQREADVAISNSLEAGLGAIWGEDPRYFRSNRRGLWPRVRYAMKTVVLAPRRDGELKVAWARLASNVVNNVIENSWLPPSATTAGHTTLSSVNGLLGRLLGNLWGEFWPDVRDRAGR